MFERHVARAARRAAATGGDGAARPAFCYLPICVTGRMRGALDARALRAALGVVVARHDAMRTRLTAVPGQAARHLQIVTPAEHFELPRKPRVGRRAGKRVQLVVRAVHVSELDHLHAGPAAVADEPQIGAVDMHGPGCYKARLTLTRKAEAQQSIKHSHTTSHTARFVVRATA